VSWYEKAAMQAFVVAAAIFLVAAVPARAAGGEPWCHRDLGNPQQLNCGYRSLDECRWMAGTMSGSCEPNPNRPGAGKQPNRKRRAR
jgi:hypothetical protein